ncbi:putative carboxymuconolactone decarboxylase [Gordonia polyisoprenivorans VH2]|uniref:Putative carboxymuconolactone decarboxylase n=1 Tax=Gordonia polyisoprenivorans (strain DSM 44266 / VH2) TaxID=1112204 RepID=H6N4H5_GORPV|nr:carboxymuconolactone decarboxylase family protein [Gordonia polyisoprenivorans]AFA73557.1 putative carboxymuconolactone decarboxylase [Gordonia polyisoprenivorans VH2]
MSADGDRGNGAVESDRVGLLSAEAAAAAAVEVGIDPKYLTQPIWTMLLRRPKYARALYSVLTDLLFRNTLPERLRELLIMRIGWATNAEFEWAQHWKVAGQLGVPEADILAVRDWSASDRFDPADRAALRAADEVIAEGVISDETWAALGEHFGEEDLIELVAVLATWYSVSIMVRSLHVPLDEGMQSWPPHGTAPASRRGD